MDTITKQIAVGCVGLLAGALVAATPLLAQQEQTIRGEIVDPAAYLKDGRHGPELVNQTYEALDGGQTLAVLDDTGEHLYLLLAEEPGEDPNELVYDYVNQHLLVKGTVYERGGVRGIVVRSVEPIDAAPAPPAEPAKQPETN